MFGEKRMYTFIHTFITCLFNFRDMFEKCWSPTSIYVWYSFLDSLFIECWHDLLESNSSERMEVFLRKRTQRGSHKSCMLRPGYGAHKNVQITQQTLTMAWSREVRVCAFSRAVSSQLSIEFPWLCVCVCVCVFVCSCAASSHFVCVCMGVSVCSCAVGSHVWPCVCVCVSACACACSYMARFHLSRICLDGRRWVNGG